MTDLSPSDGHLARYLAGELPAEERARVDAWLTSHAAHADTLARVRAMLPAASTGARWNVDAAWDRVNDATSVNDTGVAVPPQLVVTSSATQAAADDRHAKAAPHTRPWFAHPVLRAAAALALMAGIGVLWRVRESTVPRIDARYATGVGRVRSIVLPDSTLVALGPSSTMRVLAGYGRHARVVELSGEAWFQVRHDAVRPFSVRTANTVTQDIGTAFTVRALSGDSLVRVVVHEGAATLRPADAASDQAVLLRAHEVGVVVNAKAAQRVATDSSSVPAWRTGQMMFDQAPLSEVLREFRRWYPVVIVLPDSALRGRRVTATLPTRDLTEALTILQLALGVSFEPHGDSLVVK